MAVLQGLFAFWNGIEFLRHVRRELNAARPAYAPPATVFLPCKGLDTRLTETLRAVTSQTYPRYEVICAVESATDPAYAAIEQFARAAGTTKLRVVIAPLSEGCSQKIANLLAALEIAAPETELYAFLDSDAVPHPHWLAALAAPLHAPATGATTGFRWYVPSGSWAALLRCVWNAAAVTFLGEPRRNFCWGGSTAIRRETFEKLNIAQRWRKVLSEDYEVTRAVREAGLTIHFVPRCLIPSDDEVTWAGLWQFARRQLVITRVCHAVIWRAALVMALLFNIAFWGLLAWGVWAAWRGATAQAAVALGIVATIYALAAAKSVIRQRAIGLLLADPAHHRGALTADALGAPLVGLWHLALLIASGCGNSFWWRDILYEMRAVDHTIIVRRKAAVPLQTHQWQETGETA